jgi:hypothetical protein
VGAAIVLGAIGTATGLGSLAFTVFAWKTERRDRQSEIAIERSRLDAETADRARQRRADITASQIGFEPTQQGNRVYKFRLRNMGPSYSKHVRAWLQTEDGSFRGDIPLGIPLNVGEQADVGVVVPSELWNGARPTLLLYVQWFNDEGREEAEVSNLVFDYNR